MSPRKRHPRRPEAMPQIIARIHWHPGMSREELDKEITEKLDEILFSNLSRERAQEMAKILRKSNELPSEMFPKLDAIIFNQAGTLGWRLLVSCRVLKRMSQWWAQEANGPGLFERLGKALAKSARIVQKRRLPPLDDPGLVPFQDHTVRELRFVFRELKGVASKRRAKLSDFEAAAWFVQTINDSEERYGYLKANLDSWLLFLIKNPALLRVRAFGQRSSPAVFFIEWLSWCKGHDPETIRKKISRLRNSLKNQ
jgi:hypothetical protein